ncbi:MAG: DUF262 domain-containing protein [Candidatus Pacearchaeota archaeon]
MESKKKEFPEPEKRTVTDIIQGLSSKDRNKYFEKYVLPPFQRGEVWAKKSKEDLIDSIRRGWPIGCLMLAKEKGKENSRDYLIIDGQQRVRTLIDYNKNPSKYMDFREIAKSLKSLLLKHKALSPELIVDQDAVEARIEKLLKKLILEERDLQLEGANLITYFKQQSKNSILCTISEEVLLSLITDLNKTFKDYSESQDISNYVIPVIIFKGSMADLPDIFALLNKTGTKLNKYDIFSAEWHNFRFHIEDQEIMKKLKEMYENRMHDKKTGEQDIEIAGYDPVTFLQSEITLAEYLVGFGKKMHSSGNYQYLFNKPEDLGFKIYSVIFKNHLHEMDKLKELFEKYNLTDKKKLSTLQLKIEKSIAFVYSCLSRQLAFFGNKKKDSYTVSHSQTQMMAFIGTVFHEMFDIENDFGDKTSWRNAKRQLEENLPLYYLRDLLQNVWNDKHPEDIVEERINQRYYLEQLDKKKWDSAFETYKERSMEDTEIDFDKKTRSIRPEDKIFINYLYLKIINQLDKIYEVDHLVPYDRLLKRFKELKVSLAPINSIANLCLITQFTNSKKKNLTIGEFKKGETYSKLVVEEKNQIDYDEKNMLCLDLNIPMDKNGKDSFDYKWFRDFLDKRFDYLKEKFYKLYNIS